MRILYLGDIVSEETIDYLEKHLNNIKREYKINLVFANGENVNRGKGLYKNDYTRLMKAGISALSMGNHTYSKKEIYEFIEDSNICRPANMYKAPGKEYITINYNNKKITIINLLGRVFMNSSLDCPFRTFDRLISENDSDYIIVDFHSEATSEKKCFAYYVDGRCNAVLGTHTHIQTADEQVLPKNTLYITDLGMCGPQLSVIGDDITDITERFLTGIYKPSRVAKGNIELNGVIIDLDKNTIERFNKKF